MVVILSAWQAFRNIDSNASLDGCTATHRAPLMHTHRLPGLLPALCMLGACSTAQDADVQLRILETSDVHMHVIDYDYFQDQPSATVGLARTAALLNAARAEAQNHVLVDNGDLLQGNPLAAWSLMKKTNLYSKNLSLVNTAKLCQTIR
jgi:2',3'-cyclic-nucleotide 2'-phosphodiesterase (5'-nucleotidase family)